MSRSFNKSNRLAAVLVPAALALSGSAACAGNVGVDVNLHFGNQPQQVIIPAPVAPPPAPVYVSEPPEVVYVREPPEVVTIEEDVDFVYPSRLGFYVAVGVPYDLFYTRNNYYLFRDGRWFIARGSRGPWMATRFRDLPPGLRRHSIERIREHRRAEHDIYRRDRDHYRGRHFVTGKEEWQALRKAEKEQAKQARREEKEYRKEVKRAENEERKHHRGRKHDDD